MEYEDLLADIVSGNKENKTDICHFYNLYKYKSNHKQKLQYFSTFLSLML